MSNIIHQKNKLSLKDARLKNKINQEKMASMLGMTKKTYIQYEKYRQVLRVDEANKFSKITKTPMENIIFFVD